MVHSTTNLEESGEQQSVPLALTYIYINKLAFERMRTHTAHMCLLCVCISNEVDIFCILVDGFAPANRLTVCERFDYAIVARAWTFVLRMFYVLRKSTRLSSETRAYALLNK